VAALYRDRDVVDRGILQIDFANAFNTLRREAIICSVNRHAPQLLGYALAAYEKHSALVVGDRGISSQCGVQQGDPLGPLLFSLVMHDVVVPPNPGEQPPVPAAPASSQAPVESAPASLGQPEPLDAAGGRPTPPEPAQAPGSGDPAVPPPPPVGSPAAPRATDGALSQAGLDLLTFFLDDGAAGGELDTLGHWLQGFEDRAAAVGLSLNRGKCRLSVAPGATIPEALQGIETFPLDDIQHLGVPCGSPETMRAFVEEAAKSAERKMRMIASLPDAHVALTLLKFCAGFVSVVHLMRAVGAVFDFACIDQATQSCLATITGIETDASAWALASLPVRLGGLGLHSCADTAAIAHIAATFDGEACLPSLVTPYVLPHAMLLDEDDTFLASLEDPRLAPFESVLEKIQNVLQARDNYGGRGQKVWSATVHDERRKALLISMTEELGRSGRLQGSALALKQVQVRARIQSCSAQHASAWLYGNAEADPRLWLSPAELAVAIRLRLGLPIAPMPSICRLCGTGSADVDGVHARSCFSGGRRTRMHNALRDVIADFARRGLLAPAVERPVFSNTERKRPDISYVRDGTTVVLDVAVTFPLQPSNPTPLYQHVEYSVPRSKKKKTYESVLEKIQDVMQARTQYEGRGQKVWSSALATEKRKNLLDLLTEELARSSQLQGAALSQAQDRIRARIQSSSGKHASAWLYGNPEADTGMWLSSAELAVAVRLRLGLPIAAAPGECRLCGHGATDVIGSHAQTCFGSGRRTRLHNALRDIVADFARRGLLGPSIERA
ncbi:hypothetical protein DIPPA_09513, partial [Diplonema papillatum]